jgi:hypothetical protein
LLNSIQDERQSETSVVVSADAPYAKYLQSPSLDRPIMSDRDAAEAQAKMIRNAEKVIEKIK